MPILYTAAVYPRLEDAAREKVTLFMSLFSSWLSEFLLNAHTHRSALVPSPAVMVPLGMVVVTLLYHAHPD